MIQTKTKTKRARRSNLFRELTEKLRGAGVESAPLEATVILREAGGTEDKAVALAERRAAGMPLAYILGRKEFMSMDMAVDERVMVPRPETEALVETAERWARMRPGGHSLAHSRRHGCGYGKSGTDSIYGPSGSEVVESCLSPGFPGVTYLDVGTGSGCIAVALLARDPRARAVAVDISEGALAVARTNARSHGVSDRLRFVCCDAVGGLSDSFRADVVVSNPPYIPDGRIETLQREVRDHEPAIALGGGPDGLDFYRRLADSVPRCLEKGGVVVLEMGFDQASRVSGILSGAGLEVVDVARDLAGIDRVVVGRA
jgi:release factor glutamine methyltransferase